MVGQIEMQHCAKRASVRVATHLPRAGKSHPAICRDAGAYKVELIEDLPEDESFLLLRDGRFHPTCAWARTCPALSYIRPSSSPMWPAPTGATTSATRCSATHLRHRVPHRSSCGTSGPHRGGQKRDHLQKLGRELDLFDVSATGPGLPLLLSQRHDQPQHSGGLLARDPQGRVWEIKTPIMLNHGI